jgi:proteasome lid subunit RPN8/RPN11
MTSLDVRAIDTAELRKAARPMVKHELTVFIAEEAFDRAVERGSKDTSREIGGVLVGEVLHDDRGPYLKIEATIDALHADEKGAELTFTHATWEHIHKEMDTRYEGKRVVGWYHTHPGFGVFLSDRDQFIHKSFFNLPYQVALVYDPKSKEHGVFAWRDNDVWRLRRYAIGAREHTWDGNRAAAVKPADAKDQDSPVEAGKDGDRPRRGEGGRGDRDARDDDDRVGNLASFAIGGVLLVLLGGFVGHWFGSSGVSEAIRQAQVEIAKARSEGSQLAVAQLQHELVSVLRETLGDAAIARPVIQAVTAIDAAIAALNATVPPASSAAVPPAGGATAPPASSAAVPPAGIATAAQTVAQLQAIRGRLVEVANERGSAEATLAALQRVTRQGSELRADLVREVAEQRAGVGALYAELAADVAKGGDLRRAKRLLATAAHLDPGGRSRYQAQLHSIDKGATLPPADDEPTAPLGPSLTSPALGAPVPGATAPGAPTPAAAVDAGTAPPASAPAAGSAAVTPARSPAAAPAVSPAVSPAGGSR